MKIVAGIGSLDAYIRCAEAGADEVFCGYVPESWNTQYGLSMPMNRREVMNYPVQIGSESDLRILRDMTQIYGVPVILTLNALYYLPEQYAVLESYIRACADIGFTSFIVADPALMLFLRGRIPGIRLHISGEIGEINAEAAGCFFSWGASRVIFHRKVSPSDMAACIRKNPGREYEAFVLNEMCHFHGGFCMSVHCDEFVHMCRMPYRLAGLDDAGAEPEVREIDAGIPGAGGCGLCALWKLRNAGVTHLKIVSRGNHADDTVQDIRVLRRALDMLDASKSEKAYRQHMKESVFSGNCGGNCYYR